MTDDLFPRAKRVGIGQVRSWLPQGRQEGDEWVAINPVRPGDKSLGSFRFNMVTGLWSDFADNGNESSGSDAVSLYAYLHRDRLYALTDKYKNREKGLQTEAAKEILEQYDMSYFPTKEDRFDVPEPKAKTGSFWEGWTCCEKGVKSPPELELSWYEKQWGKVAKVWEFVSNGKTVMYCCRFFDSAGKKQDRPFTLWTNGAGHKWRAKTPEGKYPLWNADELSEKPNHPVILYEGQKAASILKPIMTNHVCIGWYGGINAIEKQDWAPLAGHEVWFPFDGDSPGRKVIRKIKKVADDLDIILHVVHPPLGVKKKWDHADAVEEGWDREKIEAHLSEKEKKQTGYIEDGSNFFFDILGYSGQNIVFYPHGTKIITEINARSLNKGALMTLQDRDLWGAYYAKDEGGIAWDCAVNHILREAEAKPIFSQSRIRRTGAWIDSGKLVVNTGEYLIIDGKKHELYESPGNYVYERGEFLPYCEEPPMMLEDAKKLTEMLRLVNWQHDIFADILAGWITLAPWSGALTWRPYVWLTGEKGKGKTWILSNIIHPMTTKEFGIFARGTSTEPGIRDALMNNTLATVIDEMESDNKKQAETIEMILRSFREGSSKSEAKTFHGTADGKGRNWSVQSIALFASIGAAFRHTADMSRFTNIVISSKLRTDTDTEKKYFMELEDLARVITIPWARSYHSRTYSLFAELQKCIIVMTEAATSLFGSRRQGDQLGTLLAGAWIANHDKSITAAEAKIYLEEIGIGELFEESGGKSDEELVLDEILSSRIEISTELGSSRLTLGAAVGFWANSESALYLNDVLQTKNITRDQMKRELEQYGVKPVEKGSKKILQVAAAHPAIKKMLRATPWELNYESFLGRLSCCLGDKRGPSSFAGIQKRFRELDIDRLFVD